MVIKRPGQSCVNGVYLDTDGAWITVVETNAYLAQAKRLMDDDERAEAVEMIAKNPEGGELIVGTGGVRKARFAIGGRGKSGGVRLVYYYYNEMAPVFMLTVFAKGDKENLTKAERNELGKLSRVLVDTYGV